MTLSLSEKIGLKLLYTSFKGIGLANIGEHPLAIKYINNKSKIFDLGGNVGNFSKEITNHFNCTCYCVEPDPVLFQQIPRNEKIKKYNIAVTDSDGQADFILSDNKEANSFNPVIASLWRTNKVISVQTRSLRSLTKELQIESIDVLKVDIEGSEIPLLKSLTDKELISIPQITIEFHEFIDASLEKETHDTINRLKKLNFRVVVYSAKKFSDVLFLNNRIIKLNFIQRFWYFIHSLIRHGGYL